MEPLFLPLDSCFYRRLDASHRSFLRIDYCGRSLGSLVSFMVFEAAPRGGCIIYLIFILQIFRISFFLSLSHYSCVFSTSPSSPQPFPLPPPPLLNNYPKRPFQTTLHHSIINRTVTTLHRTPSKNIIASVSRSQTPPVSHIVQHLLATLLDTF